MLSRRGLLAGGLLAACSGTGARAQAVLGDDGLYRQSWFLESLLELADDLAGATDHGKGLMVMWELRGCPACRRTHLVNFADPRIAEFVQSRFDVLQLNILGAREVTDFDGEKVGEKRLAQKWEVTATPTFQFFARGQSPGMAAREIRRAEGYLEPDQFLALFKSVVEGGRTEGSARENIPPRS
jgi:thioredoxin-related protein